MSSKNDPEPPADGAKSWSLAARLTVWYAASSFAVVFAVAVVLYQGLKTGLEEEDNRLLADKALILAAMLREKPPDLVGVRREVEFEMTARRHEKILSRIMDGEGRVVAVTPGMPATDGVGTPPTPRREGPSFTLLRDSAGTVYRLCTQGVVTSEGETRILQIAHDLMDDERMIASYRERLLTLLGAAFVACATVGYVVVRRSLRPVEAIAEAARRVRSENLRERLDTAGLPSELRELAETFNAMLDRLEGSFERLSRFSADLAHELRTPVHRLRGEAEVVLARERTPEEYREALASCLEECVQLSDLIDRLLFLARAEDPRTQVERKPLHLAGELASVREFYGPSAEEAGVRLEVEPPVDLEVRADQALLRQALGNLVSNALAHTPRGGRVSLSVGTASGGVRLEVRDTGSGIPPEHLSRVFDRFYRADGARTSGAGGAGLGLAIVKSIMALHGGRVELESAPKTGTRVGLVFPCDNDGKVIPPSSSV